MNSFILNFDYLKAFKLITKALQKILRQRKARYFFVVKNTFLWKFVQKSKIFRF